VRIGLGRENPRTAAGSMVYFHLLAE